VTVYLNYLGDNSGMLLNPQKFRSSMPSIFGPDDCQTIIALIFNSCIKCAFQQTSILQEMLNTFSIAKDEKQDSYTQIRCMNKNTFFFHKI
jgi:hypothetical protein